MRVDSHSPKAWDSVEGAGPKPGIHTAMKARAGGTAERSHLLLCANECGAVAHGFRAAATAIWRAPSCALCLLGGRLPGRTLLAAAPALRDPCMQAQARRQLLGGLRAGDNQAGPRAGGWPWRSLLRRSRSRRADGSPAHGPRRQLRAWMLQPRGCRSLSPTDASFMATVATSNAPPPLGAGTLLLRAGIEEPILLGLWNVSGFWRPPSTLLK
jgi:hypothetical protein